MTAFAWSPTWCHDHESFWSVSNKIAFANDASVTEVVCYLLGTSPRRREALLFPEPAEVLHASEVLGLDSRAVARHMFAGLRQPTFSDREPWRVGVRYCATCLQQCFHLTGFQDTRLQTCPIHRTPLKTACPFCGRLIDPLCPRAWSCSYCGAVLASPAGSWPVAFQREPHLELCVSSNSLVVRGGGDSASLSAVQLADVVFEELMSVSHVHMGAHQSCLAAHAHLEGAAARPIPFTCPVAAAAIVCASRLGVPLPGAFGSWFRGRPQVSGALAWTQLQYLVERQPSASPRSLARDAVRGWYVGALEFFVSAAAGGTYEGCWVPSLDADLKTFFGSAEVLWSDELWAKSRSLLSKADQLCQLSTAKVELLEAPGL